MSSSRFVRVATDPDRCVKCGFCASVNVCHSDVGCVGCMSCYWACPYAAKELVDDEEPRGTVRVTVDGAEFEVPERVTIKRALELLGYRVSPFPGEGDLQAPCGTGGCYSCVVEVNGELARSCITPVRDGDVIRTDVSGREPLRIVHGPQPHAVGGKATPWYEKGRGYVEVAIWVAGCNLRCPQCQNYHVTYDNVSEPMTPREAASIVTYYRRLYGVRGLAISGGEPTLNRRWLVEYFRELRRLNSDPDVRLHLDSNGTLLTPDYVDELVEAGCNNIGVEPKGARVETFMRITGIADSRLAERYLRTAWAAVKYIADRYAGEVYLGVGVPYNSAFMSMEEVAEIGDRIASIDPDIQVCVLDYFPAFRRRDLKRPSVREMLRVKRVLNGCGLKHVIVQTKIGHLGP